MGKRGHHKKNVKKEKSKVKFKVGRSLPKGQNITDTSFKVKKIVIKEQLKTGGLEPVTKRNLNLKETLSRLQHYNTNMKLDNLSGLKEILTKNQDLLSNNLLLVLEKLAELITDKESSVRKEAISQLAFVIGQASATKLSPFVCLLCSYLGAALSHINKDIQADALLLLDGILSTSYLPPLILSTSPASPSSSHPFELILQGLLNQISQQKEVSNPEKTSGWERRLNVDPGAKLADSQRRVKVLHQLRSLLKSALEMRKNSRSQGSRTGAPKSVLWRDVIKCGGCVPVVEPSYSVIQYVALPRTCSSSFNVAASSSEPLSHGEQLKGIVTALVPILMESWKEVGPSKDGSSNFELTLQAAELLKIILDLLFILLEALMLCEKDSVEFSDLTQWFRTSFGKSFFNLLMPAFPFSCSGFPQRKNRIKRERQKASCWVVENVKLSVPERKPDNEVETKTRNSECIDHNLLMAQLFCTLELSTPCKRKDKQSSPYQNSLDRILKFLSNSFEDPVLCHRHEKQMSTIIWSLLTSGRTPGDQAGKLRLSMDKIKPLIHSLVICCLKECPYVRNSCIVSCHFFKLLCSILMERNLEELHSVKSLDIWLKKLPEMLCLTNYESVKVLASIARQCNLPAFHTTLKAYLPKIFFSLKVNPEYSNPEEKEKLKAMLALLHWIQDWDAKNLKSLGDVIQRYPKEASSLVELLRTRKVHLGEENRFSRLLNSMEWWQNFMHSCVNDLCHQDKNGLH